MILSRRRVRTYSFDNMNQPMSQPIKNQDIYQPKNNWKTFQTGDSPCGWRRQNKETRNEASRGVPQQVKLKTILRVENKKNAENQRWRLTVI